MPLQTFQYANLRVAKQRLGLTEDAYRTVLLSTAHVHSSTQLDNVTLEDVMAVFERMGFVDSKGAGYWQGKVERRGQFANERTVHLIERLARSCRYSIPQKCEELSEGRTIYVEKLTPAEAYKLVEMLKSVNGREAKRRERTMEDDRAQHTIPF